MVWSLFPLLLPPFTSRQGKGQPSTGDEMSLKRLGRLGPLPMPRGLPGEAWDLIIDVHDVHVQLRGGSESLTVSHFHNEMITARKQPSQGGSQALLTLPQMRWREWGKSFPFPATPSPYAPAELDLLSSSLRPFHFSSYSYCPGLPSHGLHVTHSVPSFFMTSQQSAFYTCVRKPRLRRLSSPGFHTWCRAQSQTWLTPKPLCFHPLTLDSPHLLPQRPACLHCFALMSVDSSDGYLPGARRASKAILQMPQGPSPTPSSLWSRE